ncbi:MAG: hypothetical protein OXB99_14600, partial [Acidimicrobiaceae bacterium]|nr:hypothetical protein [Acidimicrobiaceae bacterium]
MSLGTSFGAGRHRWRAGVRLMVALVAALLWVSPVDPALAQSSSESGPEIASGPAIVSSPAV